MTVIAKYILYMHSYFTKGLPIKYTLGSILIYWPTANLVPDLYVLLPTPLPSHDNHWQGFGMIAQTGTQAKPHSTQRILRSFNNLQNSLSQKWILRILQYTWFHSTLSISGPKPKTLCFACFQCILNATNHVYFTIKFKEEETEINIKLLPGKEIVFENANKVTQITK